MNRQGQPSAEQRAKVLQLVGLGEPHVDICVTLGCSMDYLQHNFQDELLNGRVAYRHMLFDRMEAQSVKGSLNATTKLLDRNDGASMVQRPQAGAQTAAAGDRTGKVVPLGKKEALVEAARHPDENSPMGALMRRRQVGDD